AIVVSNACMMVAIMAQATMLGRTRSISGDIVIVRALASRARNDAHIGAHARAQHRIVRGAVDADADRNALDDLDPVAAGVLRRKQRELRAGAGADGVERAGEGVAGIGVDRDLGLLAGLQLLEIGFLGIGVDPDMI